MVVVMGMAIMAAAVGVMQETALAGRAMQRWCAM